LSLSEMRTCLSMTKCAVAQSNDVPGCIIRGVGASCIIDAGNETATRMRYVTRRRPIESELEIEKIAVAGVRLVIVIAVLFVLAYVVFVAAACLMCRGLDRELKTCFPLTKRPPY